MNRNLGFWLYAAGAVTVLIATVAFVFFGTGFLIGWRLRLMMAIRWVMIAGVALNVVGRVMTLPKDGNFRVKRLNNLLALSSVMLVAAAYFMFIGKAACIAFILISAFIDLWVTYRMPNEKK